MEDDVIIREYPTEVEAYIAAAVLHSNLVPSEVVSTGRGFHTTLAGRAGVCVAPELAERALKILDGNRHTGG